MKTKITMLICLTAILVLSIGYQLGQAEPENDEPSLKIGVVNIRKIFLDCKRNIKYIAEVTVEQNRIRQELGNLSKEIEAEESALKTIKTDSSDYLVQVKAILEKRASLEAKQEYLKQQRSIKDKQWTEQIYKEILQITKELAEQKELDLVFEEDEPEFPIAPEQFMLVISTHKLLYSRGCVDLTSEVMEKIDAARNIVP